MKRFGLFLIAAFLGLFAYFTIPIGLRLVRQANQIASIAAAGDPISVIDLQSPVVDDRANAVWHIAKVQNEANRLYFDLNPILIDREDWNWSDGLTTTEFAEIENMFRQYKAVLEAIDEASQCTQFDLLFNNVDDPLVFQDRLLKTVENLLIAPRVNHCRIRYLAASDRVNEATVVVNDTLGLINTQQRCPSIVAYMSNAAARRQMVRTLAELITDEGLSESSHRAIDRQLRQSESAISLAWALTSERAIGIELVERLPIAFRLFNSAMGPYLDYMNAQINLGDVSSCDKPKPIAPPTDPLVKMVAASIEATRNLMNLQRAELRALRIYNSLHHSRKFPEAEAINILKSHRRDPYSGQSIIALANDQGWVVYSVGANLTDDSGDFTDDLDVGFSD